MSIWVYDVTTRSHTQVEAESVSAYVDLLHRRYAAVVSDYADREVFGARQANLCIYANQDECGHHMAISVYEKLEAAPKVGMLSFYPCDVEVVYEIAGGLADDGSYVLTLNEKNFRMPFSSMLEMAMVNLQTALNKEIQSCAKE